MRIIKQETLTKQDEKEINSILDEEIGKMKADEKELEEIINQALTETSDNEEIKAVAEVINHVEKDKKVPLKTDDEIFREIIKFRAVEHNHFIEIIKELHYLKKHYMKVTTTLLLVACFGAYIAGTQHQSIAPFVGKVYDVFTNFKAKGE